MTRKYAFVFEKMLDGEVRLIYADETVNKLVPERFEYFDVTTLTRKLSICVAAETLDEGYIKAEKMCNEYYASTK